MTPEEAKERLTVKLWSIADSGDATNARVRAAMAAAILDGADFVAVRDLAVALGLHKGKA